MFSVGDVVRAARNGRLGLDAQGELANVGRHRGRQVAQAGGALGREVSQNEARENRIVIDKFIDAIEADQQYGRDAAQVARDELHHEFRNGTPLEERHINRAMARVAACMQDRVSENKALAERYSNPLGDHQGIEPNVNSEWRRLRQAETNEPIPRLNPDNFLDQQALLSIKAEILALGDNGKHQVTEAEAREIAESHLATLVERVAMDEILEASAISVTDRERLWHAMLVDPTLNRHTIAYEANLMRLENFLDTPGNIDALPAVAEFPRLEEAYAAELKPELKEGILAAKHRLASRTAKSLDQRNLLSDQALRAGLNAEVEAHIAHRLRLVGHARREHHAVLGHSLIKAVCAEPSIESERDLDNLAVRKTRLLECIENHNLEQPEEEKLTRMALTDPGVNTPEDVGRVLAARRACWQFSDEVTKSAAGSDPSNAYVAYRNALGELSLQDGLRGMTLVGAKALPFDEGDVSPRDANHKFAYSNGWHHGARAASAPSYHELLGVWQKLTNKEAQQLKSGVQWLAEQHGDMPGTREVGEDFYQFSTEMPKNLATQIRYLPSSRLAQAADTPVAIAGEEDVPDGAYNVFRDLDVPVPLPNAVGRSQEDTAYGERFNARLLAGMSERASEGSGDLVDGMDPQIHQEFGQAKFSVNEGWHGGARLAGDAAQRKVSGFFGDDDHGKLVVSRVMNASMFADFATATAVGDGPFSLAPEVMDDPSLSRRTYSLYRARNGDYLVGGSERRRVEALVNPHDGSVVATDPLESYVSHHVRMAVDTRGGAGVPPRVRLVGPATCSYRFVPQEEQEPPEQD